mmetsp:Transcript_535/g.1165  ORF Transcript_535/g.1165 Transcript_535/m.1165 type:complete len:231 (+) Transcript_535:366-1058(+)
MALATVAIWKVPSLLIPPPFSTTPSEPTSTMSTRSITNAAAESSTKVVGMPAASSTLAMRVPECSGRPSVTTTVKFLPALVAALSTEITTREKPCVRTTPPSRTNRCPRAAILARACKDVSAKTFPRSIRRLRDCFKSWWSTAPVRVTYLMNSSQAAAREMDEGWHPRRESAADLSSFSTSIMVEALLFSITKVSALIAATATAMSPSLRSAAWYSRTTSSLAPVVLSAC